jgi:hypothetical protein
MTLVITNWMRERTPTGFSSQLTGILQLKWLLNKDTARAQLSYHLGVLAAREVEPHVIEFIRRLVASGLRADVGDEFVSHGIVTKVFQKAMQDHFADEFRKLNFVLETRGRKLQARLDVPETCSLQAFCCCGRIGKHPGMFVIANMRCVLGRLCEASDPGQ